MTQLCFGKVLGPRESDPTPDEIRKGCEESRMLREVSIAEFIEENCELDTSSYISRRELNDAYREYCHVTGRSLAAYVNHTKPRRTRKVTAAWRIGITRSARFPPG
jgi:hypothetical protein